MLFLQLHEMNGNDDTCLVAIFWDTSHKLVPEWMTPFWILLELRMMTMTMILLHIVARRLN